MTDQKRITELEEGLRSLQAYVKKLEKITGEYCDALADDSDRNKAMAYILAEKSYRGTNEEFLMEVDALVLRDNTGIGPATVGPANRVDN